ncbi:hypothetical protein DL89DRAFT_275675 [Linderina pennispora]|uniref:RING-type E3 ubiquitin transferase n=1 Tax=Linderina pennispora TaxID=61395 RepID=A0A1Y1W0V0_9FUNG|nr:uncharacterized protein DL89DRAFT_275675 [Linderina pennispora]ORX67118.1 hypothetical protein DL89DRAFT_275675 [Linderina pennispora]
MADYMQSNVPRLAVYGIATTVLTAGVIVSAFMQHQYFYTACVQLAQSSASMMVLANMGILLTILLGKLLVRIFFGQLRTIEVEHLYEQGWFAVTETCLALTIFRDEFDAATLTLFVFLLFCKVFHWIMEDRVSFMEQQPRLSKLFIARMGSLAMLLAFVDMFMLAYAVRVTRMYGATMMIVFGFEYALLLVHFHSTSVKFVLNAIDMRRDGEWEEKASYVFYLEMLTDLAKLIVYVGFIVVLMTFYGLPLHILRDVYMTTRSFVNKCRDWVRYRRAMQNMHLRYPTVSEEELEQMSDRTCIICREDMNGPARQKLPCGHVFHFNCLRSWLERQQSCPTCRHTPAATSGVERGRNGRADSWY